jgi:hypothetical protein
MERCRANTLGSLLVMGQEFVFHEQIVKYKFTFSPSPYAIRQMVTWAMDSMKYSMIITGIPIG